ncbi:deaminase [Lentibacillus cibarius]|uniref:deaminase n=1 Tax=Lentibacillus cibarius TaxID=2583219 RepID=UPI001F2D2C1E|nr:deaminase [Lentibacillus cibarius]
MDQFMERAVELAVENVHNGGEPFGAVLVKNGKQVTEGVNELHNRFDITAHAEIQAMRKAQKMMHTHAGWPGRPGGIVERTFRIKRLRKGAF